jgi:hypothetical protein
MEYLINADVEDFINRRAKEVGYCSIRRYGNTTRAIDYYIQKLFKNKVLIFKVPTIETMRGYCNDDIFAYDFPVDNRHVQKYLFENIVRRLRIEHEHLFIPIKGASGEGENQIHIDGYTRIKLLQ